jgi:hypothetical protein
MQKKTHPQKNNDKIKAKKNTNRTTSLKDISLHYFSPPIA